MRRSTRRMIQTTIPTTTGYQRHRTCERKKAYISFDEARKAVISIQHSGKDLYPDFELRPYFCNFCKKIHVGHSNIPRSSEARLQQQAV